MSSDIDVLRQRRSIRKYRQQPIPFDLIKRLLEAASYAPSAHNAQPWRFIVIANPEQKAALADAMAQVWLAELERDHIPKNTRWATVDTSAARFIAAPALILACLSMEDMNEYLDTERQKHERDLALQSLGAAVQNLLLQAQIQGLGACWYCAPAFCKSIVRQVLNIPDDVEPHALLTVGYPAETPKMPPRHGMEDFAFLDQWGKRL